MIDLEKHKQEDIGIKIMGGTKHLDDAACAIIGARS